MHFNWNARKKQYDNDLRKSGSYHLKRLRFETVADLGEGSPLSSRSISATARVDIGEGAGLWNWWRLSVTYYRFRCLGGVECICSVNYRKRKKKACDFKLERIRTENKRGMSDWTKIFRFFFEGKMNTFESKVEYLEPKATLNAYQ